MTAAPVHQLVGHLRELTDSGTLGPWEAHARPWQCNGKPVDEWNIRTAWIHGQLKDKAGVVSRSLHFSDDEKDRHGVWLTKEDAELIAAAVNTLPAMLAIAEAAKLALDHMDGNDVPAWLSESYLALGAALSSLPNSTNQQRDAAPTVLGGA